MESSHTLLLDALVGAIGRDGVLDEGEALDAFTEDWRRRYKGRALCVALPSSTAQVASIVRLCRLHATPVLPQGGNTSLCGGAVPDDRGPPPVIVNLGRMRRIRRLDAVDNSVIVEAGCVLATLQRAAADAGRLYPVSLGAEGSCQIGGTISTNAGGTSVLRYGNTRDNVLGLEAVLADGSIWDGLRVLRKNNTGFDLKHLFIGAEGLLGIVTAAALRLHARPSAHATAWLAARDPQAALETLDLFQSRCASRLSAFEMINGPQLDLVLTHLPARRDPLGAPFDWHVLVELADAGDAQALDDVLLQTLEDATARGLLLDAAVAKSEAQRAALWAVRHSVSEANRKAGVGLTSDTAVRVSAVPRFIDLATAAVRAIVPGMTVAIVAHLGDGNVHFIPFLGFAQWDALAEREATAQAIRRDVNDVAHALGGTFSAEHGVGHTLLDEMTRYKSPVELALMHAVKQALDPGHLFNPGRMLPAQLL